MMHANAFFMACKGQERQGREIVAVEATAHIWLLIRRWLTASSCSATNEMVKTKGWELTDFLGGAQQSSEH